MDPFSAYLQNHTRRQFFGESGLRLGGVALAGLLGRSRATAANVAAAVHPMLPGFPQHAPKAKHIIYLHMNGAPSQLDLWDYKPRLQEHYDKDLPDSIRNGQRITTMTSGQARFPVAPSLFKFAQHGKCGRWVSELLPYTAQVVDEISVIRRPALLRRAHAAQRGRTGALHADVVQRLSPHQALGRCPPRGR